MHYCTTCSKTKHNNEIALGYPGVVGGHICRSCLRNLIVTRANEMTEQVSVGKKVKFIPGKSPKYKVNVVDGRVQDSQLVALMNALNMGYRIEFSDEIYVNIAIG